MVRNLQQTNDKDDNNVIKIISLRHQASKVVRLINHSVSHASVVASFHLRTSSQDPTVGSEIVWEDCALLWFNPLLEGQVEIRNSYDSLPTFICTIANRSVRVCVWDEESTLSFFFRLFREARRREGVAYRREKEINSIFYYKSKKEKNRLILERMYNS